MKILLATLLVFGLASSEEESSLDIRDYVTNLEESACRVLMACIVRWMIHSLNHLQADDIFPYFSGYHRYCRHAISLLRQGEGPRDGNFHQGGELPAQYKRPYQVSCFALHR